MSDNLVIALTGPGAAAVAVVRIAGPLSAEFLRAHFSRTARAGGCVHGDLRDGHTVIDDVVVALSDDGGGADINVHGSPWMRARVIDLATEFGFRVPDQLDEPSLQAADGPTLLEREQAAWLPLARSELTLRMLAAQTTAWETLRAHPTEPDRLREMEADAALWRMLHPPRVAIAGRPNVGKSTLANQLFGRERSITAAVAGTTRDWVGEYTIVEGLPIMLVDTPGIRETEDRIESEAIAVSHAQISAADLVLLVVDASQPAEAPIAENPAVIPVNNKCDLLPEFARGKDDGLYISAKTGEGMDTLRSTIARWFGCADVEVAKARWWTKRQREALERGQMP